MHGISIKIDAPDGRSWTVPFQGTQLSIGRTADNDIVLEQHGVSSHHCVIGRDPTGAFVVQDRGSTNGTWIGDRKADGATSLQPGVKVLVGSYQLTLETGFGGGPGLAGGGGPTFAGGAAGGAMPAAPRSMLMGVRGPLLRKSEDEHARQRLRDRVARYAQEWDQDGRPSRLLLRGRNLARALDLLEFAGDADEPFGDLEASFIRASSEGRERGKITRLVGLAAGGLAVVGLVAWLATRDWGGSDTVAVASDDESETESNDSGVIIVIEDDSGDGDGDDVTKEWVEHVVIPAETLEEIALRYGATVQAVSRWNGIDENTPLEPGRIVKVHAERLPLPQQQVTYRPDKRESWSSLAQRFDVPVAKLQAYNPDIDDDIKPGMELTIWVDPKPLRRKDNVQIPEFEVRPDAISIGAPRDGKIENAIQFPAEDNLYKRRNPSIMWCSSHMAKHLREAIAAFRYTYEFDGEIVVADMSRKRGGKFPPHGSHQAGRDVDIWLPSLKGVYQPHHIREGRERRPNPDEADWFALYGFLKALHETGEVQQVFLAYELHDRVYQAAKLMGANDEELAAMIAYPRGQHFRGSLLQHSDGHVHHIHVRFKCGPNDRCSKTAADYDAGD